MSHIERMLALAADISRVKQDDRRFCLGAVAERRDGLIVSACNGNPKEPDFRHHAEFRLSRKLTKYSTIYVARTLADGNWGMAKPCPDCMKRLKSCGAVRVYWTEGYYLKSEYYSPAEYVVDVRYETNNIWGVTEL